MRFNPPNAIPVFAAQVSFTVKTTRSECDLWKLKVRYHYRKKKVDMESYVQYRLPPF